MIKQKYMIIIDNLPEIEARTLNEIIKRDLKARSKIYENVKFHKFQANGEFCRKCLLSDFNMVHGLKRIRA